MAMKRIKNERSSKNGDGGRKEKEKKLVRKDKLHTVKWSRDEHVK